MARFQFRAAIYICALSLVTMMGRSYATTISTPCSAPEQQFDLPHFENPHFENEVQFIGLTEAIIIFGTEEGILPAIVRDVDVVPTPPIAAYTLPIVYHPDHVLVTGPVPEIATFLLIGSGLLALAFVRRRIF